MERRRQTLDVANPQAVASAIRLERGGRVADAEQLLLQVVDATERESRSTGLGVLPVCYERLAMLYRRGERYSEEVAILERFARQKHAPGAMPAKLLKRLENARRLGGYGPDHAALEPPLDRSPIGTAEEFLASIRSARHYGGQPVVDEDAPLRRRDQRPTEVALPPGLTEEALIREARSDPGLVAMQLEALVDADRGRPEIVIPWARDAWLLAGDLEGAFACLPEPGPSAVWSLQMNTRLTLKHLLGLQLEAKELFALCPPKVTSAVEGHRDQLVELVQARLDAEHAGGSDPLRDFFLDPRLETSGWPLWNASFQVVVIDDARYGLVSALEQGKEYAATVQRAAENALREDLGLPHVGQGWVSETRLFVELENALGTEVVQHGVPDGFGLQHLDVWIPAWRIGVEYQGVQHFQAVDFFGGEDAFARTVERDREKRAKARRLGITLISVEPGYDLGEVVARIHAARAATASTD